MGDLVEKHCEDCKQLKPIADFLFLSFGKEMESPFCISCRVSKRIQIHAVRKRKAEKFTPAYAGTINVNYRDGI